MAVVWDKPGSRSGGEQPPLWHAALAGLSALLVGIGLSRFGYAPLIPALIQAGWFDTGEASYLGATNLAGYKVVGAALAPRLAAGRTTTGSMRGSMVLATASFVACAFPLGFWWYVPWRIVSGVVGGLLMVLAPPAVLASVRPELRGRVGGIAFTGVGAGIALSGTVVPWAISFGLPGRVSELAPLEYRQQVWGWMTMVFAIVYAGTAYVLSYLFVRTGSYDVLFAVGAVALLLGGLLGFASPRHVRPRGK